MSSVVFFTNSPGSSPGSGIALSYHVYLVSLNVFAFYDTDILEEYNEAEVFCTNKWLIERLVVIEHIEFTLQDQIVHHDNGSLD